MTKNIQTAYTVRFGLFLGFVLILIVGLWWFIANGSQASSAEETKRMTICLDHGGSWDSRSNSCLKG